ncbi:hypothetical protein CIK05_13855 [Bdellovibrio sp. qaytius]|nr:hypothetical protein CIK05_13855 [Bdellovibrio sp. qaytius]
MKKMLVTMMLLLSSSVFAAVAPTLMELNEADSKAMYNTLAKWGTRYVDQERNLIRIDVEDVLCRRGQNNNQEPEGCRLVDINHKVELTRTDSAGMMLARLLETHLGSRCDDGNSQDGYCLTAARLIRCWYPWDPKNPPVLIPVGRRYICWLEPVRVPAAQ